MEDRQLQREQQPDHTGLKPTSRPSRTQSPCTRREREEQWEVKVKTLVRGSDSEPVEDRMLQLPGFTGVHFG